MSRFYGSLCMRCLYDTHARDSITNILVKIFEIIFATVRYKVGNYILPIATTLKITDTRNNQGG